MFNLDEAMSEWRRQMLTAGVKSPVPLEELDAHLRDEIERLTQSGLDEAEAFRTAIRRIGPAQALQNEFRKAEDASEARRGKARQMFFVVVSNMVPLFMGAMALFKVGACAGLTSGQQISCLAATATMLLLVWGGRLGCGFFPVLQGRRTRAALGISVCALTGLGWILFFRVLLPRYDFTLGQLVVTIFWAMQAPAGVLTGWIWGMETAARRNVVAAGS